MTNVYLFDTVLVFLQTLLIGWFVADVQDVFTKRETNIIKVAAGLFLLSSLKELNIDTDFGFEAALNVVELGTLTYLAFRLYYDKIRPMQLKKKAKT
jgi:hypothetical protein